MPGGAYGPEITALLSKAPDYPLVFGKPDFAVRSQLEEFDEITLLGGGKPTADRAMADACRAALWLRFDFMEESHEISQELHTPTGSFWHGILHRREPDWSNGKYWFNRVGEHAIFPDLAREAAGLAKSLGLDAKSIGFSPGNTWDPIRFIDACERAHRSGGQLETWCRQVQLAEWQLLFDHCLKHATKA